MCGWGAAGPALSLRSFLLSAQLASSHMLQWPQTHIHLHSTDSPDFCWRVWELDWELSIFLIHTEEACEVKRKWMFNANDTIKTNESLKNKLHYGKSCVHMCKCCIPLELYLLQVVCSSSDLFFLPWNKMSNLVNCNFAWFIKTIDWKPNVLLDLTHKMSFVVGNLICLVDFRLNNVLFLNKSYKFTRESHFLGYLRKKKEA